MLKNFFKITLRSLGKNKLFVSINTIGLGITLACCIVAYLNFEFNVKFDSNHTNGDSIYRLNFIRTTNGYPVQNGSSPIPIGNVIRESFSQVDKVARYSPTGGNFRVGDELFGVNFAAVEEEWFNMFTFEWIHGSPKDVSDRSTIYINETTAERFFADANPVGELMTYVSGDKQVQFKVGGVYKKPPVNSSFQNGAFVHYDMVKDIQEIDYNSDWALFCTTFLQVNNPENVAAIEDQLKEYVEIQNRAKEDYKVDRYYLDNFADMAIRAEREDTWNHWTWSAMPPPAVIAPLIMAIAILLIACFNFTNTSIAIANRRLKEIGLRKVMGSDKKMLVAQFLGENMILALMGLALGLVIAYFLVPAYSNMWPFLEISLDFGANPFFYVFLIGLLLFTGFVAGSYPAFYVTSFRPANILRGNLKYGGSSVFTKILLTVQYSISVIAIVSGLLFAQNAKFQEEYDMGFVTEAGLVAFVDDEDGYNALATAIDDHPAITSIAGSAHNVTGSWYTDPIKFEESELDADILDIGDDYLNTIKASVVAGRDFIKDSQSDVEESVIVNEELVRIFGWKEPIGKRIVVKDTIQLFVVGVVKDMYLRALWEPIRPSLLRYTKPEGYRFLTANISDGRVAEVHDFMESKWKEVFPDRTPNIDYLDEELAEMAEVNGNIEIIFSFLAILATMLSVAGLYSLVTLNIIKRMKEIGVRKVLGAKVPNIAYVTNRSFLFLLVLAAVLGSVGGYFLTDMLMASIWTYYQSMSVAAILFAVFVMFSASIITVGQRVFSAARANPVDTLRNE